MDSLETNSIEFQDKLNQAIKIINEKYNSKLIYLIGSGARNELRVDSDIDLAFLTSEKTDSYAVFQLANQLSDIFDRHVDLIDLNQASVVFKTQVVATGKNIFRESQYIKEEFEMITYKSYALLNEERKEILNRLKEEGTVYG